MMKLKLVLLSGASAIGLLAATGAHAQGIPVIDGANLSQSILNVVDQGTSLVNQGTMIMNQAVQFQQMVRNAQSLPGLVGLLGQFGLSPDSMTADQLRMVMNDVYALQAASPTWEADMRQLLNGQGWVLPQSNQNFQATVAAIYSPTGGAQVTAGYARVNRDLTHYSAGAQQMSSLVQQEGTVMSGIQGLQTSAATLGDTSEVATLHQIAAGQAASARQADLNLKMTQIVADSSMQSQLKQVESDTAIADEAVAVDQGRSKMITTNVSVSDPPAFKN